MDYKTVAAVIRVLSVFVAVVVPAVAQQNLANAALQDRGRFPEADHPYLYYLVADQTTARVLVWTLSSTSLTQEIELCYPKKVVDDLWRMDIRNLGWRHKDWKQVLLQHPYGGYSVLVRGDWLVTELMDAQLSAEHYEDKVAAYYRLLYQGKPPKNEAEFLKFWEVDTETKRFYGQIETPSQVNHVGRRWIETRERHGGYYWFTRDAFELDSTTDPLENPSGDFKFDGSEAIVGFTKFSSSSYRRGAVQYYALFNGQGGLVNEAPVQLVEDSTRFRGFPTIRTFGSCVKCHVEGIRPLENNAFIELSAKHNVAAFAKDPEELRRFHLTNVSKEITRNQEDYVSGVWLHTRWTPQQLAEALENVVRGYERDLDLAQAARELGVPADRLQGVIQQHGQRSPLPAGIAMLPGGGRCSRELFAEQFQFLNDLLRDG